MLNTLLLGSILLLTIFAMVRWGIARTFVFVFVPATLFFTLSPPVRLPGLPNLVATTAIGYGVMIGLVINFHRCWAELHKIKLNALDGLILLMIIPPTISVFLNNTTWDAISRSGEMFFDWIVPYTMARVSFADFEARKALLPVICYSTITLGCMAAVEARLRPYFFSRSMEKLKIAKAANEQVFDRYGLMRAQTTLGHPIDLGNMGVILGGMIIMLTPIAGRRWQEPLPMAGVLAAGVMVIGAVSFTGLAATLLAFILLTAFRQPSYGPRLIIPATFGLLFLIVFLINSMLNKPISLERPDDQLEASVWIRVRIVQEGWPIIADAGLFGLGQRINTTGVGTGSIDNAYLLFVMQFGWLYLATWVALAFVIAWYSTKTLLLARTPSERIPVAALSATILAIMLAMYTVFFGFVYALYILVLFGFLSSMWQIFSSRALEQSAGYPAMPGNMPYARMMPPGAPGGFR